MDVEKLRKMNEMAVELKKHHLAADSREAVAMADDLFKKDGEDNIIKKGKSGEEVMTNSNIDIKDFEDIQKQVKSLVYQNRDSSDKICMLIEKMNEMIAEIKRIDGKVINLRSEVKESAPAPKQEEVQKKIEPAPSCESKAEDKKEAVKDAKDLTPDDVSIEKYFYYGNK